MFNMRSGAGPAPIVLLALAIIFSAIFWVPQLSHAEDVEALLARVKILYDQGKYEEAIPLAERAFE